MTGSIWTGDFGDAYTARQPDNIEERAAFWRTIIPKHVTSILEVGANTGMNLEAISQFSTANLLACEPNNAARYALLDRDVQVGWVSHDSADSIGLDDGTVDLAFTCGVLIHVAADKLLPSMREIYRVSRQWIVTAEYFGPQEEMIPYRGTKDTLWRRDYGSIWMDNFPDLRCHSCSFAWKRLTGMDNLTVWVFEKGVQ